MTGSYRPLHTNAHSHAPPVHTATFHPFDHTFAYAAYGDSEPICVYTWDSKVAPLVEQRDSVATGTTTAQLIERSLDHHYYLQQQSSQQQHHERTPSRLAQVTKELTKQTEAMRMSTASLPRAGRK